MRKLFVELLKKEMKKDMKIWVLLGGVGYGLWETNDRVINCEASEQAMVDMAVGLALSGQIPFVYAITPHLYRAFEGIRNYLAHEKIAVNLVGVGRNRDYGTLGFTHYAEDANDIFDVLGIQIYEPTNEVELRVNVEQILKTKMPSFLSLPR